MKTKTRSKRGGRRTARRTSDRVSRIAARLMREMQVEDSRASAPLKASDHWVMRVSDLKALCGSVLSQDEHRGKRSPLVQKPKRRGRAG